ncbi:MAG TPA: hypothetical protein VNC78_02035 [Actinomycetota bacterium]|nr:hypothetical protein [Actinomycetota bacterium]
MLADRTEYPDRSPDAFTDIAAVTQDHGARFPEAVLQHDIAFATADAMRETGFVKIQLSASLSDGQTVHRAVEVFRMFDGYTAEVIDENGRFVELATAFARSDTLLHVQFGITSMAAGDATPLSYTYRVYASQVSTCRATPSSTPCPGLAPPDVVPDEGWLTHVLGSPGPSPTTPPVATPTTTPTPSFTQRTSTPQDGCEMFKQCRRVFLEGPSKPVRYPAELTLTGRVENTFYDECGLSMLVHLHTQIAGGKFETIGSTVSDASGIFEFKLVPERSANYWASIDHQSYRCHEAGSEATPVRVRVAVSLRVKRISPARRVVLAGLVRPCDGLIGTSLQLWKVRRTGSSRIDSQPLNERCRAIFHLTLKGESTFEAKWRRQTEDREHGSSQPLRVSV